MPKKEWKEERNWHSWPSHWWMLRASFLLVSSTSHRCSGGGGLLPPEWIAESCLCSRFIRVYRGTVVDVATTRKKFFNASSASDFRFRKNYLRILVFFFFFLLSFFFIIVVTRNRTFLLKVFGHVADFIAAEYVTNWKLGTAIRSCIIYIFISCAFKTYAITIICFRFNFSIKRQLIIQRMRPWSEKVCDINL